jgi:hypothetical protein
MATNNEKLKQATARPKRRLTEVAPSHRSRTTCLSSESARIAIPPLSTALVSPNTQNFQ